MDEYPSILVMDSIGIAASKVSIPNLEEVFIIRYFYEETDLKLQRI